LNNTEAQEAVKLWLETPFSGDVRHKRRIGKIEEVTQAKVCTTVTIRTNLLEAGGKARKPVILKDKKK
jgi:hypothetical protein